MLPPDNMALVDSPCAVLRPGFRRRCGLTDATRSHPRRGSPPVDPKDPSAYQTLRFSSDNDPEQIDGDPEWIGGDTEYIYEILGGLTTP